MRLFGSALVLLFAAQGLFAACSAGTPLLTFQLALQPEDGTQIPISIRSVNLIQPQHKLVYAPISFGARGEIKGKIALVLVPANPGHELTVLEPHAAKSSAQWEVPFRTRVVALVYGPNGLDAKKVSSLIRKDQELIEQLADYAEKTAQTEKVLDALTAWDHSPSTTENLNSALLGFSRSYGHATGQFNWNASRDQQAATLMRALNPALSNYDPLAPKPGQRMEQSAMLASSVAGLFFGSPVGLAAGGAALAVNLGSMIFPDTDFRSAFVQEGPSHSLTLCAKREQYKSRTRIAYLWAVRAPDAEPPSISLQRTAHVPAGTVSLMKVRLDKSDDWRYLGRARQWRLNGGGREPIPVRVRAVPEAETLEIDLERARAAPGAYKLAATWDWSEFEAVGEVQVHKLDAAARPGFTPESLDRLIEGAGPAAVEMTGCDFQFVEAAEIRRRGDGVKVDSLEIRLPRGPRAGPQETLKTTIDTTNLTAGEYRVSLLMPGGVNHEIPFRILPPHPTLSGLPLRANLGEARQVLALEGTGVERILGFRTDGAELEMGAGGALTIRLDDGVAIGDRLNLMMQVKGVRAPVPIQNAVEVIGPLPRIVRTRLSLPGGLGVTLLDGELPAGAISSFSLGTELLDGQPKLRLTCRERELRLGSPVLRAGEASGTARLRGAGAGILFLSFDPSLVGQPGCTVTASIGTEAQGQSHPYELGRVVRLPKIEMFQLTAKPAGENSYVAVLEGEDLELIEQVGWTAASGSPVRDLPSSVAGGGRRQVLKVHLPWPSPSPHAPLYVWLRGEFSGRATTARY